MFQEVPRVITTRAPVFKVLCVGGASGGCQAAIGFGPCVLVFFSAEPLVWTDLVKV